MQDGDISNTAAPRFILVFEGLLGRFEDGVAETKEAGYRRLHRWKRAARCWTIDMAVVGQMWDVVWRHDVQVDVATYLDRRYAEAVKDELDYRGVPVGHFMVTEPNILAKRLSYMPYVRKVFYAMPERPFIYGDRGVYVQGRFNLWM